MECDNNNNNNRLVKHRWIVPANGECKMRLLFTSKYEGQFDQTLNFEIQGTRRRYQLFCRGLCQLPTISKEPRIVFPNRKRAVKKGEIISKKYLLDQDEFQFGPLHCGKPRERYREGRYPENMETFTISNCGSIESVMAICFKNDVNASTFLLEPPEMVLQPGENQVSHTYINPSLSFVSRLSQCGLIPRHL
jgi:hydrocephalus-inducing protein